MHQDAVKGVQPIVASKSNNISFAKLVIAKYFTTY